MEEGHPSWLNKKFLSAALQGGDDVDCKVKVVSFTAQTAIQPGNNYTSHLYRVQLEYTAGDPSVTESASLIVKVPFQKGAFNESSGKLGFYGKEPKIYSELFPKIYEKMKYSFGPKSFYCPIKGGLVLSDLLVEGYILPDKSEQLDYSHCEKTMITLAKYHAASVYIYHKNPNFIESICEEVVLSNEIPLSKVIKPWSEFTIKTIGELLKEKEECAKYADFLFNRVDQVWESSVKMCKPKTKGINVMNHGDLSINNLFYKHDSSGEVLDVKFIDFQIARFASPVVDIVYFIWTGANEDVRENRLQDLYRIYLETLNNTLEQLGCAERMTREELEEDLKSSVDYALFVSCYVLPITTPDPNDSVSLEDCFEIDFENNMTKKKFQNLCNGKIYKRILPNMIKQLYNWIVLDCHT